MSIAKVEQQITINAPEEKVFNYLADISKHGDWANPPHKLHVEKTSEGPVGQGSTFKSIGQQFGRQEDTVTITEYSPARRVAYESQGKAGLFRHSFDISPSGSGVELTRRVEILEAGLSFIILRPILLTFVLPSALKSDLERIKAKVEAS